MTSTIILDLFGTLLKLATDSRPYLKLAQRSTHKMRDLLRLSLVSNCPTLSDYANLIGLEPQNDINYLENELQKDLQSATLYDDTLDVLGDLQKAGVKLVLISNLATPYKTVVCDLDIGKYFDAIVYSCDCGLAKPDSSIYQHALNQVQSMPMDTIMVGDSYKSDVEGPSRSGIQSFHLVRGLDSSTSNNSISSLYDILERTK